MSVFRWLLLVCLCCLITGCSNPEKKLIGKWEGEANLSLDESIPFAGIVKGVARSYTFDLELRKDKSFTMHVLTGRTDGTWTYEPHKLLLTTSEGKITELDVDEGLTALSWRPVFGSNAVEVELRPIESK